MKQMSSIFAACVTFVTLSISVQAQIAPPTVLGAPDSVFVNIDTLSGAGVVAVHWDVTNETADVLDLMVTRSFLDTVSPFNYPYVLDAAGSYERFCWGQTCFNFGTDASPSNPAFLVSLEPSDTTDTFVGDFYPNGVTGNTTLRYCFHQNGPASLGACHDITFVVTGTVDAVSAPDLNQPGLAQISPNPASDHVQIRFEGTRDGDLVIRNLVGQVCKTERVQSGASLQMVNLEDMRKGVYLVSYNVDGIAVSTERLVIQ